MGTNFYLELITPKFMLVYFIVSAVALGILYPYLLVTHQTYPDLIFNPIQNGFFLFLSIFPISFIFVFLFWIIHKMS